MIRVSEETADDWWEVEGLLDLCFAPGREALSSYRLRDGVAPVAALCLVARDEGGGLASPWGALALCRWLGVALRL